MTVTFVKDKETKRTFRYTASGEVSGSIYIQKDSDLAKSDSITIEVSQAK